jgi:pimeloyl-ACP methyl ester carboxylesterase
LLHYKRDQSHPHTAPAPTLVEPAGGPTEEDEMSTAASRTTSTQQEIEQVERAKATTASISERENREIEAANASGKTPVVFIHGLWLLPSSWANWADFFKQAPAARRSRRNGRTIRKRLKGPARSRRSSPRRP